MKNVCIVGCEWSGTRWLTHMVARHPHIQKFRHVSIPGNGKNETFDLISALVHTSNTALIIIFRDQSCVRLSQAKGPGSFSRLKNFLPSAHARGEQYINTLKAENHGFDLRDYNCFADEVIENWKIASKLILDSCRENKIPYAIVSYETLVQNREYALRSIFKTLNIPEDIYGFYNKPIDNYLHCKPKWFWENNFDPNINDGNIKYTLGMPSTYKGNDRKIIVEPKTNSLTRSKYEKLKKDLEEYLKEPPSKHDFHRISIHKEPSSAPPHPKRDPITGKFKIEPWDGN